MKNCFAFIVVLGLSACATGYQNAALSISGGYTHSEGYGKLTKVEFFGNGFTSEERVKENTVRRIAELAITAKKPYFLMYQSIWQAHFGVTAKTPSSYVIGIKPGAYAYVLFLDEPAPGALEAAPILKKWEEIEAQK
ncbi:hypothetical protein [Viridibacterium curvum]|uniref:Lipoprotein n=1 Tax=Viridibacterium curvum TaxID=1101404 RepID=A0ABP9QXX1_9RHOO